MMIIVGSVFLQLIQFTDAQALVEKYGIGGLLIGVAIYLLIIMFRSDWFGKFMGKISDKFVERFMKSKTKNVNAHIHSITESDISIAEKTISQAVPGVDQVFGHPDFFGIVRRPENQPKITAGLFRAAATAPGKTEDQHRRKEYEDFAKQRHEGLHSRVHSDPSQKAIWRENRCTFSSRPKSENA
jgi:hypothetical protein